MDRRTFLQRAAAVGGTASLVGLAGCLDGGSRAGDQRSFTKTYNYDTRTRTPTPVFVSEGAPLFSKPDENHVVVGITVANQTGSKATTDVTAIVDFVKGTRTAGTATGTKTVTRKRTKSVTVAGNGSKTVRFEFEVPENADFDGVRFDLGSK